MKRNIFIYGLILVVFGWGILMVLQAGKQLDTVRSPVTVAAAQSAPASAPATTISQGTSPISDKSDAPNIFLQTFQSNLREPLSQLLVQLILIVLLARVFGSLALKLGQPAVIGEMIAGIVLGPSVVGLLFPGAFQFVFPLQSLGALRMLSQVGVILFMFVVGMELDVAHLRGRANTPLLVSHVSIVLPYFLGVLFAFFLFQKYAPAHVSFLAFALFMGITMSITAFPVLARILEDRGMTRTFLGSTALTCAAVDDISAWSILAVVVAVAKSNGTSGTLMAIAVALVFVSVMIFAVKPALNRFFNAHPELINSPGKGTMVSILVLVFSSALMTEVIGMHALFGAFLAGIVMPADVQFRARLKDRLENFSSAFLLPLFFAFTGLRTQIGLMNDLDAWLICGGLILVATFGKLGGSMFAARFTGLNWHDSFALGALMNTRGLVELIVLNIGLDLGILSPLIFAMMVIMALATTFMTGPLLTLGEALRRKSPVVAA